MHRVSSHIAWQPGKCFANKKTFPFCCITEVKFSFYKTVRTSAKPDWSLISGALVQLDISPDDIVWGINSADNIFIPNGNGLSQVEGALEHVTVGDSGVWGVNDARMIYYREGVTSSYPKGFSWTHISGEELIIIIFMR